MLCTTYTKSVFVSIFVVLSMSPLSMPLSCKGSVVLLAGVLPALLCFSHALPPRQVTRGSGPLQQFSTPTKTPVVVGWIRPPSHHGSAVKSAAATSRNHQDGRENSIPHGVRAKLSSPPSAIGRCRRKRPRRSMIPTLHSLTPGVEGGAVPPSAAASVSHVDSTTNCAPQRAASTATAGSNSKNKRPGVVEGADLPSARGEIRSKVGASPAAGGRRSREFLATSAAATPSEASASTTADKEELVDEPDAVAVVDDKGAATCLLLKGIDCVAEVAGLRVRLRVATLDDYYAIADVRFDVFSPVHSTLKHRFRERSCLLMTERRRRGAFCLVAVLEGADSAEEGGVTVITEEHVLGTLECSRHEFDGTPLAVKREAETLARCGYYYY